MKLARKNGSTSNMLRVKILDSTSTVGAGLTGLTSASSGLIISTIANNEAAATAYTVAGSTIETITTLGTYAAPTATKCRFKEVDATNHKGVYEIQLADARYAVASARSLIVSILGATNAAQVDAEIDLDAQVGVELWRGSQPNALASGRVEVLVGAVTAGVIAAASFAANALDAVWSTAARVLTAATNITSTGGTTVPQTGDSFARIGAAGAGLTAVDDATLAAIAALNNVSAAAAADAVWDEILAGHVVSGSAGEALGAAGGAGDPWITALPGAYGAGSAGKLVGDNLNATVSSRSSHTAADVWTAGTRVLTAGTNIILPANAIARSAFAADTGLQSIRSFTAQAGGASTITFDAGASASDDFYNDTAILLTGGTGAGQYAVILDYVGATKVATVDAPWVVVPDATTTAAVFPGPASGVTVAQVWDELLSGHVIVGSAGAALSAAGSAGDPWSTPLPGAYGAGTAGEIVGDNLNATVSSRATPAQVATELGTYDAPTHTELTAELATADDAILAAVAALNNLSAASVLTQVNAALDTTLSATIPADGTRPTLRQGVYMNTQFLYERTVSGTTLTVKNPDGSTLAILTLSDATTPTSVTRTT